jgi:hypothetical protein
MGDGKYRARPETILASNGFGIHRLSKVSQSLAYLSAAIIFMMASVVACVNVVFFFSAYF